MASNLKVGDTVRLKRDIATRRSLAGFHTDRTMKITSVDPDNLTDDVETHVVRVDDPEINMFMLYDQMFDLVEAPRGPTPSSTPRTDGEATRLRAMIVNTRALLDALELALTYQVPCVEAAHAVLQSAGNVLDHAARRDAFLLVECPK